MSRRRIGLLGGTFDPPHIGHLIVAVEARAQLALDEVWLVVAHTPWQKVDRAVTVPERRLAMANAAVEPIGGVVASAIEFEPPGATYTVETLERLAVDRPDIAPTLIMGADVAAGLASWYRSDQLSSLTELAVVDRPGYGLQSDARQHSETRHHPEVQWFPVPQLDVSSTDIRRRVRDGHPIEVMCSPSVISLIRRWALYDGSNAS